MWKREEFGPALPPCGNRIRYATAPSFEVPFLRVRSEHQCQLHVLQPVQNRLAPRRGTLGSRRQIARRSRARVTEAHRDDRDLVGVVELLRGHAHPRSKSDAGGVVERNPAFVNATSRGLTCDYYARARSSLKDGTRAVRQRLSAQCTRGDVGQKVLEDHCRAPGCRSRRPTSSKMRTPRARGSRQ